MHAPHNDGGANADEPGGPSEQRTHEMPWQTDSGLQWTLLNAGAYVDVPTLPSNVDLGGSGGSGVDNASYDSYTAAAAAAAAAPHLMPLTSASSSSSSPFSFVQVRDTSEIDSMPSAMHPFYPSPLQQYSAAMPAPSIFTSNDPHVPSPYSLPPTTQSNKRPWTSTTIGTDDRSAEATVSQPRQALANLATSVPEGHPLRSVGNLSCSTSNCYLMTPLDTPTFDYFKRPLHYGRFAVQVIDPSRIPSQASTVSRFSPSDDADMRQNAISRPTGKALRLLITVMPQVHPAQARSMDNGFALIVACRQTAQGNWLPACLATFEGSMAAQGQTRARARVKDVAFAANLEQCTDEATGRRIWGQRSTHVRREDGKEEEMKAIKAVRILPRGAFGASTAEKVCFLVALFDSTGSVLQQVDGSPCIACTNIVQFTPKDGNAKDEGENEADEEEAGLASNAKEDSISAADADGKSALMRELEKMTFFERAEVAATPGIDGSARLMMISTDPALHEKLGIKALDSKSVPPTALALSSYQNLDTAEQIEFPEVSDDLATRIRAAVRSLGWHHADPDMTDPTVRDCTCFENAARDYRLLINRAYQEDTAFLNEIGIRSGVDILKAAQRAKAGAAIMLGSTRTVCIHNPYPDRILIDRIDPHKVHCLADTTSEAEVMMGDRMWPLARLAFCVKAPREQLRDLFLIPYVKGFCSRGQIQVEPAVGNESVGTFASPHALHPVNGPVVHEEKFYLLLHAMHLKFFRYWILFRSPPSVRRIHRRLMEEDRMFDEAYFTTGGFTRFDDGNS